MTNLLVVDASSSFCSVAVQKGEQRFSAQQEQPRKQAQILLPMVKDILAQAELSVNELDGIAFGSGPGSFTGIRIATSIIQGLSLANEIPVYGISSLQAQAWQAYKLHGWENILPIMNAHMGELFLAGYQIQDNQLVELSQPQVIKTENLSETNLISVLPTGQYWKVAGDGAGFIDEFPNDLQQLINEHDSGVRTIAESMLDLAITAWQQNEFDRAETQQPVYLRDSVAWKKVSEQPSLLKRD